MTEQDKMQSLYMIIYDYWNGESKNLSINIVNLLSLFREKYKDYNGLIN